MCNSSILTGLSIKILINKTMRNSYRCVESLERAIENNFGKADHTPSKVWYHEQSSKRQYSRNIERYANRKN